MWRTIWAIVAVGCALNTGCTYVWGTQLEKVVVEASIVADEFVYTIETPKHIDEDGFVHAVAIEHFDPQPEDLTSIDQFIALTFYDHTDFLGLRFGRPEVEVLECERITVEDDFLSWPLRLDIGFSLWPAMFEHRNCAVPYVMAFAEGCWPLFLGSPGLSSFDTHDHGLYPPPPDADARLRCFFYRRSRAWTVHMTGEIGFDSYRLSVLRQLLHDNLPAVLRAVDSSDSLADKDRQLVYQQLLDVVRALRELTEQDLESIRQAVDNSDGLDDGDRQLVYQRSVDVVRALREVNEQDQWAWLEQTEQALAQKLTALP